MLFQITHRKQDRYNLNVKGQKKVKYKRIERKFIWIANTN